MNKIIFSLVILVVFVGFITHNSNKPEHPLLSELKKSIVFDSFDDEQLLYINVGIDYIPYDVIELFQELTNIKVVVDIFDSNEILEAKLLAGETNYDVVFPTAWPHFSRQLKADIYKKLDKKKLTTSAFHPLILKKLSEYDEENSHALPYQWGVSGIGVNEDILNKIIPKSELEKKIDSFSIIFDPKNAAMLSKYRISVYESSDELFPAVMAYLGLDPESEKEEDTLKAANHLMSIRKYITKFTAYGFEDLASGNACIALGTSGDIVQVNSCSKKQNIKFIYPKEGASLWVDLAAIPKKAKHINNAYAFLKFLFYPKVIAHITDGTSRANAVKDSLRFIKPELVKDKNVYPTDDMIKKCFIEKPISSNISSLRTRLLTNIKSMDTNDDAE